MFSFFPDDEEVEVELEEEEEEEVDEEELDEEEDTFWEDPDVSDTGSSELTLDDASIPDNWRKKKKKRRRDEKRHPFISLDASSFEQLAASCAAYASSVA